MVGINKCAHILKPTIENRAIWYLTHLGESVITMSGNPSEHSYNRMEDKAI